MNQYRVVLSILIFFSVSAYAEDQSYRFYLGGLIGQSDTEEIYLEGTELEKSVEGEQGVIGIYGGYKYNSTWSVELSAAFMELDATRSSSFNIEDSFLTTITMAPRYTYAFNDQFSVFAKLGLGALVYMEEYDEEIGFWDIEDSEAWYGIGVAAGLGLEIKISEKVDLRLGYEVLEAEMEADEDNQGFNEFDIEENFSMAYIGMNYRF
ncbi:outer membrane protein [Thalassotalea crassostreae]|uniref:outer membrane protein n=1 Tax=Thalassotalea crassostreae TaxID=1763536 RepID=UPI000839A910|nr:porin family protein [Thalassotalea crassostreae]